MKVLLIFWRRFAYLIMLFFLIVIFIDVKIIFFSLLCMIIPIIIALLGGKRFWCKYLCPRGSLYYNIGKVSKYNARSPKLLRTPLFRLIVLLIIFYMLGNGAYTMWGNYDSLGLILYNIILITTSIGVIIGYAYHPRTWCCFCPTGTIVDVITYIKKK